MTKTTLAKSLYVKGATLVDPSQKWNGPGEILIENGMVVAVGKPGVLAAKAKSAKAKVVDGKGLLLAPGFVDLNTHVPDPGAEQRESYESVGRAAARGGFTTLATQPVTQPVHDNAFMTDFIRRRAREHCIVKVEPVGAATAGREGKKLAEIGSMIQAGAVAISEAGTAIGDSYLMRKILEYSKAFGIPMLSYPEDRTLVGLGLMHEGFLSNRLGLRGIPAAAEEIGVYRDTVLAKHTGGRLHMLSLSTAGSVKAARRAKEDGLVFTADTNPHYFSLLAESIATYDSRFKCLPPLREEADRDALIEALADGTLDCISTQHIPQPGSTKDLGFEQAAFGMIGLETAFSLGNALVQSKHLKPMRLVELLSINPAKVLGLKDRGSLRVGSAADFVLLDAKATFTLGAEHLGGLSRNTPFMGMKMRGMVVYTFVNGTQVYKNEQ